MSTTKTMQSAERDADGALREFTLASVLLELNLACGPAQRLESMPNLPFIEQHTKYLTADLMKFAEMMEPLAHHQYVRGLLWAINRRLDDPLRKQRTTRLARFHKYDYMLRVANHVRECYEYFHQRELEEADKAARTAADEAAAEPTRRTAAAGRTS